MAVAALILGILSIVLFCIPFVGVACGVAALVLGILGMKKDPQKKGMCIAGIVLGSVGIVIYVLLLILGMALQNSTAWQEFLQGIEAGLYD